MKSDKAIRILFLVPESLPTFRADVAALFCKYLPTKGVSGTMVGQGNTAVSATPDGFRLATSNPHGGRLRREFDFLRLCLRTLRSARSADYEIIQVRDMVTIGAIAALFARTRGIKFVYWMSFLMCEGRLQNAKTAWRNGRPLRAALVWAKATLEKQLLYGFVLRRAAHVFVQSDAMLQHVARYSVDPERMTAVPMGVDTENTSFFVQSAAPAKAPTAAPLIGYLGTLDAQRQLGVLIEALVEVRKHYPTARLVLVGGSANPADLVELRQTAANHGVSDAVEFTGWLPIGAGWQRICNADVCVSPVPRGDVLDTGSPTKLVEYMALGLPCIGNDNPDQRLVLEQSQAGWLVTGHTAHGYATAILEILNDQVASASRAAKGPAYVAAHRSYRVLAERVAAAYQQIAIG